MDNNDNKAQNAANQLQQSHNAEPAETGEGTTQGKTFTQEEVNQIVSDRLKRERAKQNERLTDITDIGNSNKSEPRVNAEGSVKIEERDRDLLARENVLQCRELLAKDSNYPKEFLDVLDTSDFKAFKEKADKLLKVFPSISPNAPHILYTTAMEHGTPASSHETLSEAFGLNK